MINQLLDFLRKSEPNYSNPEKFFALFSERFLRQHSGIWTAPSMS